MDRKSLVKQRTTDTRWCATWDMRVWMKDWHRPTLGLEGPAMWDLGLFLERALLFPSSRPLYLPALCLRCPPHPPDSLRPLSSLHTALCPPLTSLSKLLPNSTTFAGSIVFVLPVTIWNHLLIFLIVYFLFFPSLPPLECKLHEQDLVCLVHVCTARV